MTPIVKMGKRNITSQECCKNPIFNVVKHKNPGVVSIRRKPINSKKKAFCLWTILQVFLCLK